MNDDAITTAYRFLDSWNTSGFGSAGGVLASGGKPTRREIGVNLFEPNVSRELICFDTTAPPAAYLPRR